MERIWRECRERGYIETLAGRRRWLVDINSADRNARAAAERAAVNMVLQGSAADLAKHAMLAVARRTGAELPAGAQRGIVHMIHDESVLEVDAAFAKQAAVLLRDCMQGAARLRVPLRARLSCGRSWGQLQEMELAP